MSAIKVGDLVMVVRPKKCCAESLGAVFKVAEVYSGEIYKDSTKWMCRSCGASGEYIHALWFRVFGPGNREINVKRLKKIDPPALPESVTEREELSA